MSFTSSLAANPVATVAASGGSGVAASVATAGNQPSVDPFGAINAAMAAMHERIAALESAAGLPDVAAALVTRVEALEQSVAEHHPLIAGMMSLLGKQFPSERIG